MIDLLIYLLTFSCIVQWNICYHWLSSNSPMAFPFWSLQLLLCSLSLLHFLLFMWIIYFKQWRCIWSLSYNKLSPGIWQCMQIHPHRPVNLLSGEYLVWYQVTRCAWHRQVWRKTGIADLVFEVCPSQWSGHFVLDYFGNCLIAIWLNATFS